MPGTPAGNPEIEHRSLRRTLFGVIDVATSLA
jgi:hypothetical protein